MKVIVGISKENLKITWLENFLVYSYKLFIETKNRPVKYFKIIMEQNIFAIC